MYISKNLFSTRMQRKSMRILTNFSKHGVFKSFKYRQIHACDVAAFMGQPTGYTHPHLMSKNDITPGISRNEYSQRRTNLINKLKTTHFGILPHGKHVIIVSGSPEYHMAPDIPYPFRQNSNFLYLTGYQEPDTVLILEIDKNMSEPEEYKSILFTRPKDPLREIWDGPRTGIEGAVKHFGFDEAYPIDDLGEILMKRYNNKDLNIWYDHLKPVHISHNKEITDVLFNNWKFKCTRIHRVGHLIETLRVIKSPAEISLLKKCTKITSEAKRQIMRETKPGISETHLHNILENKCKKLGATRLSFPPVVAGGAMANTLHYISNDKILKNNDLVLVDSGCEYHGYCSDVTRVWPINGRFSPAQKELYEALLNIQNSCIKLCQVGVTITMVYREMLALMDDVFEDLGLLPKGLLAHKRRQYTRDYCPHNIGHYIGMDVHDTNSISKDLPFREGMVITIEPGVYVRENQEAPSRFHGIGIRIEDDIMITDKGPVVLTSRCPKDVNEIEKTMATSREVK